MFKWLGEPEEFADPKYEHLQTRYSVASSLYPLIQKLFADKTRAEIVSEGQTYGVPTESVQTATEVLATPHFRERGAFTPVDLGDGVEGLAPHGCFEVDDHRLGIRRGPLDVTIEAVIDEWRTDATATVRSGDADLGAVQRAPLGDLVVLDLGVIVVGAETSRLFADFGADVIKVENRNYPDGNRQTNEGATMSMSFAMGHRNKRGLGINLRSPQGRELFLRLVAKADVVLSNFKPGTLESLGLGYEELRRANPDIVTVESSALGKSGPWSDRMGYGPLVRAVTGLSQLWRYPDQPDGFCDGITIYPDHTASRLGAIAALACLLSRSQRPGGAVSIAQFEVILSQFSEQFLRESIEPGTLIARGNAGEFDAPYGVFPCAGHDEWCVITVQGNDCWQRLCSVLGDGELAADQGLASPVGRVAARERIESAVSSWTTTREARDVMCQLQRAGVPAGVMNRVSDLRTDPQVAARAVFRSMHQPQIGDIFTGGAPARFSSITEPSLVPAPMYGEHTRAIAREYLALNGREIEDLLASGVLDEGGVP